MTTNRIDLTKNVIDGDYAVYLPAISSFVTTQLGKSTKDPLYIPVDRMPVGFENGTDGLNFLDREKGYFHYKWALYSAGHAERDLTRCDIKEPMIHKRDRRNTILISDSGGFQLATGVIKMDWANVMTPAGDPFREEILRYSEKSFDYSMTLDIPAFAASPAGSKRTGLTKFRDTLDVTLHNLDYFVKHRVVGATKFLNVLSGTTPENSKEWFDEVIPYSIPDCVESMGYTKDRTLEGGFAMAGVNMKNMSCALTRLLELRDLGMLDTKEWIHFLGIGRLDWACYLTSIQKQIRKYHNPGLTISYDAASPYVSVAYGLAYNYNYFTPKKLTYSMDKAIDEKKFKGSKLRVPFQSPIMDRLTVGDLCVLGDNDPNKNGKIGKTSWDTFTYLLYMSHNVYNHISAVQEINRLAEVEHQRYSVNYRDWAKTKKSSMVNEVSQFVPSAILFFDNFVTELFDPATKDPFQMIVDNKSFLDSISFGGTESNMFDSLFDAVVPTVDEDKFADVNDEKLQELEDSFND